MDHTKLLKELFEYTAGFNFGLYEDFLGELCKTYDREQRSLPIEKNEESAIAQKSKIGRYKDNQGKYIDFLVFKLKNGGSIQKARHLQRNVISSYLKDYGVYNGVDHVIAVFYADGYADWRLSFVKQQFKLDPEKKKVINEFTPAKRFSFLIEKGSKNQTIRKQSFELLKASIKPNINEIEKIFSVGKVTKEFFDNYKGLYGKLKEAFENDKIFGFIQQKYNLGDPHFTENFVKKLLGQIVFLYFLQKKGWMGVQKDQKRGDGDKQFLRTLYTQCVSEKKLFFNDYLEPLFYNTLNKERPGHWSDYFGSKIPYLNGGLFQPINDYNWDGVENTLLSSNTSNQIFGEILDTFDTFNFTIYENDPLEQDVAVDPEMLGKIFENLLPDNERKGKGAFYTPREIVHYMCKQALIQYLVTKTGIEEKWIENLMLIKDSLNNTKKIDEFGGDEAKKQIWKQNGQVINNALKEVKIVDPAVGSGAFPMGILKEIVDIRRYILTSIIPETELEKNYMLLYKLKKETLSHCIYGVDLDPGAVDIAKLRFWLSLVVDYDGDHIEPLPNLDYKIMQGNSLIENPIIGDQVIDLGLGESDIKIKKTEKDNLMKDGLFERESSVLLKRLAILHKQFFDPYSDKKKLKNDIHDLENRIIMQNAKETIANLESEIANNYRGDMTEKKSKELAQKYETIAQIKATIEHLTETGVKNYFPRRLHFGEVFRDHGGFDIVIGNPPYVGNKGNKENFQTIQISGNGKYYERRMDLFYFFFHLAIDIGCTNSEIAFITTNYFTTADGAKKLRNDLKERAIIRKLINFNELKIFESALGQHNMISFICKGNNKIFVSENCITSRRGYYMDIDEGRVLDNIFNGRDEGTKYFQVPQNDLYDGQEAYIRYFTEKQDSLDNKILQKLKLNRCLSYYFDVNSGVQTGLDKISKNHILNYPDLNIKLGSGVFVLSKLEEIRLQNDLNKKYFNKRYKNSDIDRYWSAENKIDQEYVIYLKDEGLNISLEEKLANHFKSYEQILVDIKKNCFSNKRLRNIVEARLNRGNYFVLFYPREQRIFTGEKIICPYRSKSNIFAYNNGERFASVDVTFITYSENQKLNLKYLLSILNSKLCLYRLQKMGKRKGDVFELYPKPIKDVPIKEILENEQKPFIELTDQILTIKKNDPKADTSSLEKEIDQIVYKLYELTDEEIAIVEESVKR